MNYTMLDLYSGLGGASEAMLNNGWDVRRIENNPLLMSVPNTEMMDVLALRNEIESRIMFHGVPGNTLSLIWASPPCTDFSNGYSSPKSIAKREGKPYYPKEAIANVQHALDIIEYLKPRFWAIENVMGSREYLEPILGPPRMIIGSIVLWGNFPLFGLPVGFKHKKLDDWSTNPIRANVRALIPYEVSDALRQSIEAQKTLDYWF